MSAACLLARAAVGRSLVLRLPVCSRHSGSPRAPDRNRSCAGLFVSIIDSPREQKMLGEDQKWVQDKEGGTSWSFVMPGGPSAAGTMLGQWRGARGCSRRGWVTGHHPAGWPHPDPYTHLPRLRGVRASLPLSICSFRSDDEAEAAHGSGQVQRHHRLLLPRAKEVIRGHLPSFR